MTEVSSNGSSCLHHGVDAAGMVELFDRHRAARLDVGDEGRLLAEAVEVVQGQVDAGAAGDGDQVDDQVGAGAGGHQHLDGVLEGCRRHDVARLDVLVHQLHDLEAGGLGDVDALGVDRRDGGGAGQGHAQGLGHRLHAVGRAHHAAGAAGVVEAVHLDLVHLLVADVAGDDSSS